MREWGSLKRLKGNLRAFGMWTVTMCQCQVFTSPPPSPSAYSFQSSIFSSLLSPGTGLFSKIPPLFFLFFSLYDAWSYFCFVFLPSLLIRLHVYLPIANSFDNIPYFLSPFHTPFILLYLSFFISLPYSSSISISFSQTPLLILFFPLSPSFSLSLFLFIRCVSYLLYLSEVT